MSEGCLRLCGGGTGRILHSESLVQPGQSSSPCLPVIPVRDGVTVSDTGGSGTRPPRGDPRVTKETQGSTEGRGQGSSPFACSGASSPLVPEPWGPALRLVERRVAVWPE